MGKIIHKVKIAVLIVIVPALWCWSAQECRALTFIVTSDNHSGYTKSQKVVWQAIAPHRGAFAMTAGDVGSVKGIRKVVDECVAVTYPWYVAPGNHDLRSDTMAALRALNPDGKSLPNIVNRGPPHCEETTYSFRYENCHFVILNQYYDGKSDIGYKTGNSDGKGRICDALYNWLEADLDAARADPKVRHIFVTAHEPLYYITDRDSPLDFNLNDEYDLGRDPENRNRFWNLLKQKGVVAFFCGHHHQFRAHRMDENDVWQVLSAWGRGCDPLHASDRWKHVKCTFAKITVNGGTVAYEAYRGPRYGGPCDVPYTVEESGTLVVSEP
jgi:3',5'-cyclic AMP phosphodiesterase CpdA